MQEIKLEDEGMSAEIPSKKLLNAGFRILTDDLPHGTMSRLDIKYLDKQYSIAFNSSKAGISILKQPDGICSLAINVNKDELIDSLKELLIKLAS